MLPIFSNREVLAKEAYKTNFIPSRASRLEIDIVSRLSSWRTPHLTKRGFIEKDPPALSAISMPIFTNKLRLT